MVINKYKYNKKNKLIESIFKLSVLLCLFYFPIRFGVHDYFMVTPLLGSCIFAVLLIISNFNYKITAFDLLLIIFTVIVIKSFVITLLDAPFVDAMKGLRHFGFPVFYYFSLKLILQKNHNYIFIFEKFLFFSLLLVLTINLYMSIDYTFLRNELPIWYLVMQRNIENAGMRSPGLLADPHSSGLLSVCAALYILSNLKIIKTSILRYPVVITAMFGFIFATYRTAVFASLLSLLIIFVIYRKKYLSINIKTIIPAMIGLLLLLFFIFEFFPKYTYLNNYLSVFTFWITDPVHLNSAAMYTIYDTLVMTYEYFINYPLQAIVGVGFPSSENNILYLSTNDQGYYDIMLRIGIIGALSLLAIPLWVIFMFRSRLLAYYPKEHYIPYLLITLTIFISSAHSPMYTYHGITHIYYISLAILAARWESAKMRPFKMFMK
jgi:hypothetical protein